eukprot:6173103-Pleurochrysis_carterae.AAC.3
MITHAEFHSPICTPGGGVACGLQRRLPVDRVRRAAQRVALGGEVGLRISKTRGARVQAAAHAATRRSQKSSGRLCATLGNVERGLTLYCPAACVSAQAAHRTCCSNPNRTGGSSKCCVPLASKRCGVGGKSLHEKESVREPRPVLRESEPFSFPDELARRALEAVLVPAWDELKSEAAATCEGRHCAFVRIQAIMQANKHLPNDEAWATSCV